MRMLATAFLVTAFGLCLATVATSQTQPPAPPPLDEMAAELGVSVEVLEGCTPDTRPEPGAQPSREEHEARLTEMATCLQSGNPSITAASLDTVLQKYRPEPRERG